MSLPGDESPNPQWQPLLPSIAAVVFGHISKGEIDRAGGRGIAMIGLILGWIGVAFWALIVAVSV